MNPIVFAIIFTVMILAMSISFSTSPNIDWLVVGKFASLIVASITFVILVVMLKNKLDLAEESRNLIEEAKLNPGYQKKNGDVEDNSPHML